MHKQTGRENENMAKTEKEKKGETEYQESVTGLDQIFFLNKGKFIDGVSFVYFFLNSNQ